MHQWCDRRNCWVIDKIWKGQSICLVTFTDYPNEAEELLDAEPGKRRKQRYSVNGRYICSIKVLSGISSKGPIWGLLMIARLRS